MHPEPNISAPSPSYLVGMILAGVGGELLSIESRGTGVVARLELAGATYRVQLDRVMPT